jgi:thioredoxin 1
VVDFYANWCGPCKKIAPQFAELSSSIKGVVFLKVDVDVNREVSSKYEVKSMPTFLFIKNGRVLTKTSGGDIDTVEANVKQFM